MSEMLLDRPPEAMTNPEIAEVDLRQAFQIAEQSVGELVGQEKFDRMCEYWKIDPRDPTKAEFWRVVARCGVDQARQEREEKGNSLQTDLNEIIASIPNYVYVQGKLNMNKAPNYAGRQSLKQRASHFNGQLRAFAEAHPDINVREFYGGVAHMAKLCVTNDHYRDQGLDGIWTSIRGARQEASAGIMLDMLGETTRDSTIDEDLAGIDRVVTNEDGSELKLDIKASRSGIEGRADYSISNLHGKQSIKILAPLSTEELGDTMLPSGEVLAAGAQVLASRISQVRRELHEKQTA